MPRSYFLKGTIMTVDEVIEGCLEMEDGEVVSISTGNPPDGAEVLGKGLIMPRLVNCHVHIGDFFLHPAPKMSVEELVGPPNGYKHRKLREAEDETIIDGISKAINVMIDSGARGFFDFREGGLKGAGLLRSAYDKVDLKNIIEPHILGRPEKNIYDEEELDKLISETLGLGLSAFADWNDQEIRKTAKKAKDQNKLLGLHASEGKREPIEDVLDLKPDMLIHMVHATENDLELVKDADIPVAICARSNEFFGLKRDFKALRDSGVTILGGTDNSMITSPKVLEEMAFVLEKFRNANAPLDPRLALGMFSTHISKVLNQYKFMSANSPTPVDLMVLDKSRIETGRTHDPFGVLNFLSSSDIRMILQRETVYKPGHW